MKPSNVCLCAVVVTFVLCGTTLNAQNAQSVIRAVPAIASKNSTTSGVVAAAATPKPVAPPLHSTTSRPQLWPNLRLPCSCVDGQCGCCTGAILENFRQKACVNFTYEPEDFALTATMSMNGRVMFRRTVSGKNPPPMCFRIPRLPFIRLCLQLSNIYFASRNMHFCIDMEANWEDLTLIEWSFDCIRMGVSGVAVVGPEEGGGLPANPIDAVDQTDEDYDDSARNVPPKPVLKKEFGVAGIEQNIGSCSKRVVIFDDSLRKIEGLKPDRALVKIETLENGNVLVGYNESGVERVQKP